MKKILLPTDFSENAQNAINYAIQLFKNEACTFYILHSFQIGPSGYSSAYNSGRETRLYKVSLEQAEREMHVLMETIKAQQHNKKHIFENQIKSDNLLNAIGKNVVENNIDYIIMGTKGVSGVKSIFMGSNTVSVLKNIDFCPLIAIPEEFPVESPSEILFATDFKHEYNTLELKALKGIASICNSKIRVVHFGLTDELEDEQLKIKEVVKERLSEFSVEIEQGYADYSVADAIQEYVSKNKGVGMVAMMKRKHGFFDKLTREPIIKRIAFSTEIPLLIFSKLE